MSAREGSVYRAMRDAGCFPYSDPEDIDLEAVDPLIRDVVESINRSGWLWTGESCQGHPDADYPSPWAGNTDPYLRLICRTPDEGRLASVMFEAAASFDGQLFGDRAAPSADLGMSYNPQWRTCVGTRNDGWTELYVYVLARTTWDRDMGIRFLDRVAAISEEVLPG